MIKGTLWVFFLSLIHISLGQKIVPYQDSRTLKWGYKNEKNIVIAAEYTQVLPFKDDYAWVKADNFWGVIYKTQKKYILEPTYTEVNYLKNNLFSVKDRNGRVGICNEKGLLLQSCRFQSIDFWEKNTQLEWNASKGQFELPVSADTLIALGIANEPSELLDLSGRSIKVFNFQRIHAYINTLDYCLTYTLNERGSPQKWGLINGKAEIILPCEYDDIGGSSQIGGFSMTMMIMLNPDGFIARKGDNCTLFDLKGKQLKETSLCE